MTLNNNIKLDDLLSLRQACLLAKKHCGTIGLRYVDAQLAVETLIHDALGRGERPRYDCGDELTEFLGIRPGAP